MRAGVSSTNSRPFEPENLNKFKIPASRHPRPAHHLFVPGGADRSNPITRIIIGNVNAFGHRSSEAGRPFANEDPEDLFYSVDARNVRCRLDERAIGSVVRCNTSYTVVDFEAGENAMAAFKMFQGRMAYPGNYHLRLQFVGAKDRTFDMRMGSVWISWNGATKEGRHSRSLSRTWIGLAFLCQRSLCLVGQDFFSQYVVYDTPSHNTLILHLFDNPLSLYYGSRCHHQLLIFLFPCHALARIGTIQDQGDLDT